MPKTSEMFSSKSLKAADIGKNRVGVVIDGIEEVKFDDGNKWALSFKGKDKTLILNKTNTGIIEEVLGSDDTDDWMGKRIVLFVMKVEYQGKRVDAIRVSDDARDYPKNTPKAKPEPEHSEPVDDFVADDDDVPF